MPWTIYAEEKIRRNAMVLLRELDLVPLANHVVADLPYGIQKRVDVARAMATRPRPLLLDEPAAGLPTSEADEMIGRVLEATRRAGTTVIIIEHNVELVVNVADRVVVLDTGRVIADGSPDDVRRDP